MVKAIFYYATVMLFLIFEIAMSVSPSVMTHQLMSHFSITAIGLSVLSSAYYYGYLLLQIPAGIFIDKLGVRKVIVFALLICSTSLLIFEGSHSLSTAIFSRFLMGLGGASSFVLLLSVARTQIPENFFSIFSGIALFAAGIGAIFGQFAIASLFTFLDWQNTLKLFSGIGFLLAIFTWVALRKMQVPCLAKNKRVSKNISTLIKNPQLMWIAFFSFLNVIPLAVLADLWGIPYLQTACHVTVKKASFMISIIWIGFGLTSPILGYLSEKIKKRCVILVFLSILSLLSILAVLHTDYLSINQIFMAMFFLGMASSGQSICFSIIKDIMPGHIFSTASSINNMAIVITPVIFQTLVGYLLYHHSGTNQNNHYTLSDYQFSFVLLPICSLISIFVSSFCIKETNCSTFHDFNLRSKNETC